MPGSGDYLGEMLRAGYAPPRNFMRDMREGVQFGRELGEIPNQNFLQGEKIRQVQRQQAMDAALAKYAQTGDLSGVEAIDPNLAAQAAKSHEYIKGQSPDNIRVMQAAFGQLQKLGPMINSKNWGSVRKQVLAGYPTLDESDLPAENATDQQIFNFVNAVPLLNAQLKHIMTPYQKGMLEQKARHEEGYLMGQQARSDYLQGRLGLQQQKLNLDALDTASKIGARNMKSDRPVTRNFVDKKGNTVVAQWDPQKRDWYVIPGQGAKQGGGKKGDEALNSAIFGKGGKGLGKGGGGEVSWDTTREQFKLLQQQNPEAAAKILQKYPQLGAPTTTEEEDDEE